MRRMGTFENRAVGTIGPTILHQASGRGWHTWHVFLPNESKDGLMLDA